MGSSDSSWLNKSPLGHSRLKPADDNCTPGLTHFIDAIVNAPNSRHQYAPPPIPPQNPAKPAQATIKFTPHADDYQHPQPPHFLDSQLLLPLQKGFVARPYIIEINDKLDSIDKRLQNERDVRKRLALIREARDFLYHQRQFFHGIEKMIDQKKPAYDAVLPAVKKVMQDANVLAPMYAHADNELVQQIRGTKP